MLKHPGAPIVSDEIKKKIAHSIETFIARWGEAEGTKRWNTYCQKHSHKNTLQGYLDKGSTKEGWEAYNKAKAATKETFKRRYGDQADERWSKYVEMQRSHGKSLDWFIDKLGYDAGVEFYYELNKRKGITPQNMIAKWGQEEGLKRWHAWAESTNGASVSDIQRRIIAEIIKLLPDDYLYHEGAFKAKEFVVWSHQEGRAFLYDFVVTAPVQVCIEINGNFYHANPKRYKATDKLRHRGCGEHGILASEIWAKDKAKEQAVRLRGYEFLFNLGR